MANPMEIETYLRGVEYPCSKQELIKNAKDRGAPSEVMSALNGLPNIEYGSTDDVVNEIGDSL